MSFFPRGGSLRGPKNFLRTVFLDPHLITREQGGPYLRIPPLGSLPPPGEEDGRTGPPACEPPPASATLVLVYMD